VFVATRVDAHCDPTIAALDAGLHVVCEKPMANSVEECERMISAAERAGRTLAIDFEVRYYEHHRKIKEWISLGYLGEIQAVHALGFDHAHKAFGELAARREKSMNQSGAMNCGVHKLDLIRCFCGGGEWHDIEARGVWFKYQFGVENPGLAEVADYLEAVEHVANAIAGFSGQPLSPRRFLLDFPARAQALKQPGLYAGLVGLLGGGQVETGFIRACLPAWEAALVAAGELAEPPGNLHPHRLAYFRQAMDALTGGEDPLAALWLLASIWLAAVRALPQGEASPHFQPWAEAFRTLELLGDGFMARMAGLDAFLDWVEEIMEGWARERGVAVD